MEINKTANWGIIENFIQTMLPIPFHTPEIIYNASLKLVDFIKENKYV